MLFQSSTSQRNGLTAYFKATVEEFTNLHTSSSCINVLIFEPPIISCIFTASLYMRGQAERAFIFSRLLSLYNITYIMLRFNSQFFLFVHMCVLLVGFLSFPFVIIVFANVVMVEA